MKRLLAICLAVLAVSACTEKPLPDINEAGGAFGLPFGASKQQVREILNSQGIDTPKGQKPVVEFLGHDGTIDLRFLPFAGLKMITLVIPSDDDGETRRFLEMEYGSPIKVSPNQPSTTWIKDTMSIGYSKQLGVTIVVFMSIGVKEQ